MDVVTFLACGCDSGPALHVVFDGQQVQQSVRGSCWHPLLYLSFDACVRVQNGVPVVRGALVSTSLFKGHERGFVPCKCGVTAAHAEMLAPSVRS